VRGNIYFKEGEKEETDNSVRETYLSRVEALLEFMLSVKS
jgi:hypothetical protein